MKKRYIIIGIFVIAIGLGINKYIQMKNTYLYMPYEYKESEIFFPEYKKLVKPLRIEICHDSFENECIYNDDLEDLMFLIEELQKSTFLTRSRQEFEELEWTNENYSYRDGYKILIRSLEDENSGPIIFNMTLFENEKYIKSHDYYYYEISDALRDFLLNNEE